MSYNGSGTFQINTAGQPVITGTVISSTAFNALTADLATGLSTAITKDGQTATTARIPFAAGISSTLVTDSSSVSTGSIITAGGVGIAKALYVGTTANVAGAATLSSTLTYGGVTLTNAVTGTGKMVLDTSPTLVTPILGTPTSGNLVNCTGLDYDGFKNRIINGAMVIDQRNAGASVTPTTDGQYTLDRMQVYISAASKFSVQKDSTVYPTGFTSSAKITSLAATSLAAGDYYCFLQPIEGFNVADLGFGASGASTVTISFWVRSSLTGTFGGALRNGAANRGYPFTYTISSANTWEQKTVTIAGDTTGTWATGNTQGMAVIFGLGVGTTNSGTAGAWAASGYLSATGATSVVGTLNATFYITGVQLEKGSTATSFDYRPYGTELALCQRYYAQVAGGSNCVFGTSLQMSSGNNYFSIPTKVPMRTTPSFSSTSTFNVLNSADAAMTISAGPTLRVASSDFVSFTFTTSAGATTGNASIGQFATSTSSFNFSAEL